MIRPLHVNDAVIDYDAVMTSIDTIRDSYWRAPGWPYDDLTLMQNLIDLGLAHEGAAVQAPRSRTSR